MADGLASIIDLALGPDGTLYVVEFEAAGWLAVEVLSGFLLAPVDRGRVRAYHVASGSCTIVVFQSLVLDRLP